MNDFSISFPPSLFFSLSHYPQGAHVCIGQHLAQLEMKILLATLLKNLSFSPKPDFKLYAGTKLTLCPYHLPFLSVIYFCLTLLLTWLDYLVQNWWQWREKWTEKISFHLPKEQIFCNISTCVSNPRTYLTFLSFIVNLFSCLYLLYRFGNGQNIIISRLMVRKSEFVFFFKKAVSSRALFHLK